jgi:hypothetical protein
LDREIDSEREKATAEKEARTANVLLRRLIRSRIWAARG